MDVIWNCALGVDIDCQHHPDNKFYVKGVEVFDSGADLRWNLLLSGRTLEQRSIRISEKSCKIFGIQFIFTNIGG